MAGACAGQSELGGTVGGRVVGPDGRGVQDAAVRLEDAASGEHSDALSNVAGEFVFEAVTPGRYTLRVRSRGMSDYEADDLTVGLGTGMRLNPQLAPMTVHRTVLVEARRNPGDAAEDEGARWGLEDLPNNNRHWSAVADLLRGGVVGEDGNANFRGLSPTMNSIVVDGMDHTLAFRARERGSGIGNGGGAGYAMGQSSVGTFQTSGSGIAPASGRAAGGAMNTVTKSGSNHMHGQGVFYDRGAIGEAFNAYSKTMELEPAGTTVAATGQPVIYLNGQPVTYVEVRYHAPDRRQEWEVSGGGPIRRDRIFWFFAWEQHERHDPGVGRANEPEVFFAPPSAATLTTLEARIATSSNSIAKNCGAGAGGGSGSTAAAACAYATVLNDLNGMLGTVPRSTWQTNIFPKINWRIDGRNNLVLEYNMMRRTAPGGALSGASEADAVGSFGNSSTSDDGAIARWEHFATARLLSSMRVQWSRDVLAQSAGATSVFEQPLANNAWSLPPEVSLDRSVGFSFGTLSAVNKREYPAETRDQFVEALTWVHGANALRFGYEYNHVTDALQGISGENGAYTYAMVGDFVADLLAPDSCDGTTSGTGHDPCYARYRQTVGHPDWSFQTADYAAYAAAEWRPAARLTLTLGARYEYERLPKPNSALLNSDLPQTAQLPQNRDEVAPRAGFAWDVFGHGRTVLRGGYGLLFGRVPNATVFSALTSTGSAGAVRTYTYRPLDEGAPAFPHVFASDATPYVDGSAPDQESTAPDAAYFDRHFRHPQINQAEISLEQAMGARTVLTLTGMATDGHDLTQFEDANIDRDATAAVFYSVTAPGNEGDAGPLARTASGVSGFTNVVWSPQRFYYRRLNPAYGAITDMVSETNSSYRGATVRLTRRLTRALMVNAGYTWGHAIDDGQNEATFADRNDVYDPEDPRLEHGTSNYDVRQRVAGGVVVREPWQPGGAEGILLGGYALSSSGQWRTGLPYSMRTMGPVPTPSCSYASWLNAGGPNGGADCLRAVQEPDETFTTGMAGEAVPIPGLGASLNGSGGEDLIPPMGRNTYRYPATVNVDLRLTKRIRLGDRTAVDLMIEAFNALNHQNVTNLQTIGYRVSNDTTHPNMATLTWQSGVRPGTKTVMTNGTTETQYVFDPTAAFGDATNANSSAVGRERQIQAGMRLIF
jgi:hypothetical protein